jgi:hypothetical protein
MHLISHRLQYFGCFEEPKVSTSNRYHILQYNEDQNSLRPTGNCRAICAKLALRGITCNGKLNSGLSTV